MFFFNLVSVLGLSMNFVQQRLILILKIVTSLSQYPCIQVNESYISQYLRNLMNNINVVNDFSNSNNRNSLQFSCSSSLWARFNYISMCLSVAPQSQFLHRLSFCLHQLYLQQKIFFNHQRTYLRVIWTAFYFLSITMFASCSIHFIYTLFLWKIYCLHLLFIEVCLYLIPTRSRIVLVSLVVIVFYVLLLLVCFISVT